MTARTLLDKLWDGSDEVLRRDDGASLLWVDRHLVHEGSHHAFGKMAARGLKVANPELTTLSATTMCRRASARRAAPMMKFAA
jgi:3-isopropylmalate/(R)-2-methylmalate dehydratase large subunit